MISLSYLRASVSTPTTPGCSDVNLLQLVVGYCMSIGISPSKKLQLVPDMIQTGLFVIKTPPSPWIIDSDSPIPVRLAYGKESVGVNEPRRVDVRLLFGNLFDSHWHTPMW